MIIITKLTVRWLTIVMVRSRSLLQIEINGEPLTKNAIELEFNQQSDCYLFPISVNRLKCFYKKYLTNRPAD